MLAALCEHDAERAGGNFGIFEKQLVKIAHTIKQQRIRVRSFDLDILRHHRRRAVFGRGILDAAHGNYASKAGPLLHAPWGTYPTFYPLRQKDC